MQLQEEIALYDQMEFEKIQEKMRWIAEHVDFSGDNPILVSARKALDRILSEKGMTLDMYGVKHGTDKASFLLSDERMYSVHDYLRHYEPLFRTARMEDGVLLEFGCAGGNSLRLWEDYFPRFEIWGVDINEKVREFATERIHAVIGDATSWDTRDTLVRDMGGRAPFIIIDDASHAWGDQRRTLELFWDILAPGGIYIIEDLECGTLGAYEKSLSAVRDAQPFFDYIHDRCKILRWKQDSCGTEERWHMQLPKEVRQIEEELDSCQFISSAVILRKR